MLSRQPNQHPVNPFDDTAIATDYEKWYSTTGKRTDRLEKSLLKRILSCFLTSHTLLEVGCGTGHFTRWFAEQGLFTAGVDISQPMLTEAKRLGASNCFLASGYTLPFPTNAFDLVAYITALEFIPNPAEALRDGLRVAKHGLILGVLNRQSALGRSLKSRGGPIWENAHLFSPQELANLLYNLGIERSQIFWRTTLYNKVPWALPLPWGGFIGMAVLANRK
ncbi:MAG: methyltransferase domain-containing protein [Anaerolineales bacterium]|nr:methyltransferase domain-containing protein [Anaerolineales bacterium]